MAAGTDGIVTTSWHDDSTGWGNAVDIADYAGGQNVGVWLRRNDSGGSGHIQLDTIANSCEWPSNPNHKTMRFSLYKSGNDVNGFGDTYLVHVEPISWMYIHFSHITRPL